MKKNLLRLRNLIAKAKSSKFDLFVLNRALWFGIPFNKPHQFTITNIEDDSVSVEAKYKRKNLNHLRGMHACAIATIGEYASGILLISHLSPSEYRLIMARMEIDYHYQAKSSIIAKASLDEQQKQQNIIKPLETEEAVFTTMTIPVHDTDNNHIATVVVKWQIKKWQAVKTK